MNLGGVLSRSPLPQGGCRESSLWPLLFLGEPDPPCGIINLLVSTSVECKSLRKEKSSHKVSDFRGREAMDGRTALGKSPLGTGSAAPPGRVRGEEESEQPQGLKPEVPSRSLVDRALPCPWCSEGRGCCKRRMGARGPAVSDPSALLSRRVCAMGPRSRAVAYTESHVQPVYQPYLTTCQGHLCSTYR